MWEWELKGDKSISKEKKNFFHACLVEGHTSLLHSHMQAVLCYIKNIK